MQHYKPLHVALSLTDLNQITNKNFSTFKKIPRPKDAAKKLYQESQSDPLDEERTYILLSRFLNMYRFLLRTSDDKGQIELLLGKDASKAETQLCNVKCNLITRYEEMNKKNGDVKMVRTLSTKVTAKHTTVFKHKKKPFISCTELHEALKKFNLLVMDVRDTIDFKQSHIKEVKCVNIPEDLIHSGLSAHTLGITLPKEALEQWEKRDSFDVIILMDWHTCDTNYDASRLDKLRTILLDWDVGRTYNEPPVILNNGFSEWLDMFPTLCTGPNIKYTKANAELDELLNLDSIEYPYDNTQKSIEIKFKVVEPVLDNMNFDEKLSDQDKSDLNEQGLSKDEEYKNVLKKNDYNLSLVTDVKKITPKKPTTDGIAVLHKDEKDPTNQATPNNLNAPVPFIETPKPPILQPPSDSTDLIKAQEEQRQRLLYQARQTEKPKLYLSELKDKPIIDRATKPKHTESNLIINPDGKYGAFVPGLCGLSNIKNTCYMNTIIQCLRHVPEIIEFYCKSDYTKQIVRQPPVICKEFGNLVCQLWSTLSTSTRPFEFYNKITLLSPSYKDGHHEDCMEFFIQLFSFVSEDCAFPVTAKNCSSDTELAWYKQHNGKSSYFIEIFYYQIRNVQSCPHCFNRSLKYEIENVFYLTIPNYDFYLEECMEVYLSDTEHFICKKCKRVKRLQKSICHFPEVMVISLKRHVQDGTHRNVPIYKKNESRCYFPFNNFVINNVTYSLRAIAMHVGSINSGHYTAACLNPINKQWYLFNDESVVPYNIHQTKVGIQAYAFFYSKVKVQ